MLLCKVLRDLETVYSRYTQDCLLSSSPFPQAVLVMKRKPSMRLVEFKKVMLKERLMFQKFTCPCDPRTVWAGASVLGLQIEAS